MKGLNKFVVLGCAAIAPSISYAELKALDDAAMSTLTGQAGITIEFDVELSIGEVNYKDEGNLYINDVRLGGAGFIQTMRGEAVTDGDRFDNFRWDIDIVGGAADASAISSKWGLDGINLVSGNVIEVENVGTHGSVAPTINDGDLVIHAAEINEGEGVDMGLYIGSVALGQSALTAGDGAVNTGTVLFSDIMTTVKFGPWDIVIDGSSNNININTFGEIRTNIKADFLGASWESRIHNDRGADRLVYESGVTGETGSLAHFQADISPSADPAKGLRINITDMSGDMDVTNITLGTAPAIGALYFTDYAVVADVAVYGH